MRDFLESDDMQQTLKEQLPPGTNINTMLCRTLLAELKCIPEIDHPSSPHSVMASASRIKISNIGPSLDVPYCREILLDFLFHAQQVEAEFKESPVAMIDEFRGLFQDALIALDDLPGSVRNKFLLKDDEAGIEGSIFQETIASSLIHYPSVKFNDVTDEFSHHSRALLLSRLLYFEEALVQKTFPILEVIRALLRKGTDVNYTLPEQWAPTRPFSDPESKIAQSFTGHSHKIIGLETPWHIFLFYIYHMTHMEVSRHTGVWFEIAKALVQAGADLECQVEVGAANPLRVSDVFIFAFPPADSQALYSLLREKQCVPMESATKLANEAETGTDNEEHTLYTTQVEPSIFYRFRSWMPF